MNRSKPPVGFEEQLIGALIPAARLVPSAPLLVLAPLALPGVSWSDFVPTEHRPLLHQHHCAAQAISQVRGHTRTNTSRGSNCRRIAWIRSARTDSIGSRSADHSSCDGAVALTVRVTRQIFVECVRTIDDFRRAEERDLRQCIVPKCPFRAMPPYLFVITP